MKYIFTVRSGKFGEKSTIDTFYQIEEVMEAMIGIPNVEQALEEFATKGLQDKASFLVSTLSALNLRNRFNTDMYQGICMINTECEMTREMLQSYIDVFDNEELLKFLKESDIGQRFQLKRTY